MAAVDPSVYVPFDSLVLTGGSLFPQAYIALFIVNVYNVIVIFDLKWSHRSELRMLLFGEN